MKDQEQQMQRIKVTAMMADGTVIQEVVSGFGEFVALVLGFRRDRDVASLTWVVED